MPSADARLQDCIGETPRDTARTPREFLVAERQRFDGSQPGVPVCQRLGIVSPLGFVQANLLCGRRHRLHNQLAAFGPIHRLRWQNLPIFPGGFDRVHDPPPFRTPSYSKNGGLGTAQDRKEDRKGVRSHSRCGKDSYPSRLGGSHACRNHRGRSGRFLGTPLQPLAEAQVSLPCPFHQAVPCRRCQPLADQTYHSPFEPVCTCHSAGQAARCLLTCEAVAGPGIL